MDQGWTRGGPPWYRFSPLLDHNYFSPPSVHFSDIPRSRALCSIVVHALVTAFYPLGIPIRYLFTAEAPPPVLQKYIAFTYRSTRGAVLPPGKKEVYVIRACTVDPHEQRWFIAYTAV